MGNPHIVIGDPVKDVVLGEDVVRNSVEAVRLNDPAFYGGVRSGRTDDDEPSYAAGRMIILEKLKTLCDGETESGDGVPLVLRPPFMSPDTWDNTSDVQSFLYIKDRFMIPMPMMPSRYFNRNSVKEQGVWNWLVSTSAGALTSDEIASVANDTSTNSGGRVYTMTNSGIPCNDVKFTLVLSQFSTRPDVSYSPNDTTNKYQRYLAMKSIGNKNTLGSFAFSLSKVKSTKKRGPKKNDGTEIKNEAQTKTTGSKNDTASAVVLNIGKDIFVAIETNSTLKIKMNGETGSTTTIKLVGIDRVFNGVSDDVIQFMFVPVFNGLVIMVWPASGDNHCSKGYDSGLSNIFFVEKTPGVDPMQYQEKDHVFNIDNQTDVRIEAKGPPEVNVGESLNVWFYNCTAEFAYVPIFFASDTRGAYYFFSGADVAANTKESEKPHYRLLPIWCRNKTSAALYPHSYGSNDPYLVNYTPGHVSENEKPRAVPVVLKRDFQLQVTSARGYSQNTDDGSGTVKYFIQFGTSTFGDVAVAAPSAGEMIIIEGGDYAGKYKVANSASGIVTCENPSQEEFAEAGLSGVIMKLADPNVKTRKIVFGISSGKQEKTISKDEYDPADKTDADKTMFQASMQRMEKETYVRFPPQLFGFLCVTVDKLASYIDNKIDNQFDVGTDWSSYITNVTVNHGESGTTGSMVLDRYGLSQLCPDYNRNILIQQVAGLNLDVEYVSTAVDQDGSKTYAINLSERENADGNDPLNQSMIQFEDGTETDGMIGETDWKYNQVNLGLLLRGIAYGQGASDSNASNELNVPLFGLQRKLEEIKIVNAPYFDGRKLIDVLNYLALYGNVPMNYLNADPEVLLPASSNISVALVDFKLGTSVWDAMHQVAEMTAHFFVLQPDGTVWWYKISDTTGVPQAHKGHQMWFYPNARVVSRSADPDFSQFYNHIILMALQAPTTNVRNPLEVVDLPTQPLIAGVRLKDTNPNISWSKLCVLPQTSFFTEKELNKLAYRYAKQAQAILWNGSVTIPGNLAIKLLDTFSNNSAVSSGETLSDDAEMKGEFIVSGITHTVDMTTKNFTTQLGVSMIGNARYDSAGTPKKFGTDLNA